MYCFIGCVVKEAKLLKMHQYLTRLSANANSYPRKSMIHFYHLLNQLFNLPYMIFVSC